MASQARRLKQGTFWGVVALTLLAFALRLYRLDYFSLRGDESFTVLFVGRTLADLIEGIRNVEPNPPLYYFVLRAFLAVLGQSDFAARLVSAMSGVLSVPLLYQLGRVLFPNDRRLGTTVGLLAAALLAINPYQIWHSQDVRNYTLWPALSLASLYLMLRALREDSRLFWAGYVVTTLLSLYTHYYQVFVLLFENAFVFLVYLRDRSTLKRWVGIQVIVALLYLPWPLLASSRTFTYPGDPNAVAALQEMVGQVFAIFAVGETFSAPWAPLLLVTLILLAIAGLIFTFAKDRRAAIFLLLFLAVPILSLFLVLQWRPLFRVRYLNAIAPALYLCFALGLAALFRLPRWGRLVGVLALVLLLVPSLLSLNAYFFDPAQAKSADWRGLAEYLEAQAAPEDVIVQNHPDPTLAYYYRGPAMRVVLPERKAVDQVGDLPVKRVATGRALQELLEVHPRVWLLPSKGAWDPQGFVQGWLARRATKVQEEQVDVFPIIVYERAETPAPSVPYPLSSRLGDTVELLGYDIAATGGCQVAEEGELLVSDPGTCVLRFGLYWQPLAPMDAAYTVFVQVLDGERRILTQQDSQPQGGGFPTSEWLPGDLIADTYTLPLPADANPGEYSLQVGMYQLETGDRLDAYREDGQRWPDDAVKLGLSIVVAP